MIVDVHDVKMLSEKTLSWTLTSKVNIWLGNHFFLSLQFAEALIIYDAASFFFIRHHPPPHLFPTYNLRQNCWENCILGEHFSKHRSGTGCSLSLFPWKQCRCVFKRKPDPLAFVGSNIELGEGVFSPQCVVLDMMGKTFSSNFVRDCRLQLFFIWSGK